MDRGTFYDNMDSGEFLDEVSPDQAIYLGSRDSLRGQIESAVVESHFQPVSNPPSLIDDFFNNSKVYGGNNGLLFLSEDDSYVSATYIRVDEQLAQRIADKNMRKAFEETDVFHPYIEDILSGSFSEGSERVENYIALLAEEDQR